MKFKKLFKKKSRQEKVFEDIDLITIDDKMLALLGLTKDELKCILKKHYKENIDYIDIHNKSDKEIKALEKKMKRRK